MGGGGIGEKTGGKKKTKNQPLKGKSSQKLAGSKSFSFK